MLTNSSVSPPDWSSATKVLYVGSLTKCLTPSSPSSLPRPLLRHQQPAVAVRERPLRQASRPAADRCGEARQPRAISEPPARGDGVATGDATWARELWKSFRKHIVRAGDREFFKVGLPLGCGSGGSVWVMGKWSMQWVSG